jgi:hypothetical protein
MAGHENRVFGAISARRFNELVSGSPSRTAVGAGWIELLGWCNHGDRILCESQRANAARRQH